MRITALAAVLVAAIALALPAEAHDDLGLISIVAEEQSGSLAVDYEVLLVYSEDKEPVTDASITVVAERPGGTTLGPVSMQATPDPGRYRATISFPEPGAWTVRFAALTPRATLEQAFTLPAPTTEPDQPERSTTTTGELRLRPADPDEQDDDGDGLGVVGIAAAAAVATAVVTAAVAAVRRRRA